jgi:hypothetical protein
MIISSFLIFLASVHEAIKPTGTNRKTGLGNTLTRRQERLLKRRNRFKPSGFSAVLQPGVEVGGLD